MKTGLTTPSLPYRIKKKDGSFFYAEQRSGVIMKNGRPSAISCVVRDVTERKLAETESLTQQALLKAQQEASPDGILVVDAAGRILSYNRNFVDMWGIAPEVIASRSDKRALQAVLGTLTDPRGFLKRVEYLYKHNKETSHEDIRLKDGRTFERYSAPVMGAADKFYGRVWYFRDITERKRLENILKENTEVLNHIFNTGTDIIFTKDLAGRYMKMNQACADVFCLKEKDVPGLTDSDLFPPQAAQEIRQDDLEVILSGKTITRTFDRMLPSGKYCFNIVKTPLRDSEGRITGVHGVGRDITKIKKAESHQALARALESVSRKTRPMAHDFNNALAAINGYATLIDESLDAKSPIKPEIAMIMKGVKRAAKITTRLQRYARNPKVIDVK